MSIAVDQLRLRTIVQTLLPSRTLDRTEAITLLELVQLAAGADHVDDALEHGVMQSIAQTVCGLAGLRVGDLQPIAPVDDDHARLTWLRGLSVPLRSREARELTYAFVFLTIVADLEITSSERVALEEYQLALGLDDARVTDLVVFLTNIVAATDTAA